MRFRVLLALLVSTLFLISPAMAQQRVAVLEFGGALKPEERAMVADAVRGEVVRAVGGQLRVMTRENMEVMLTDMGLDASCVSEGACEVETARNLGVDYVVTGQVVSMSGVLVVSLKLHETKGGSLLDSRQVRGADALTLLDAIHAPAAELMGALAPRQSTPAPNTAPGTALAPAPRADGFLGATLLDSEAGVEVVRVNYLSPAEEAGVRAGDIITSFNGKSYDDRASIVPAIVDTGAGAPFTVKLLRGAEEVTVRGTLQERPTDGSDDRLLYRSTVDTSRGFDLTLLDPPGGYPNCTIPSDATGKFEHRTLTLGDKTWHLKEQREELHQELDRCGRMHLNEHLERRQFARTGLIAFFPLGTLALLPQALSSHAELQRALANEPTRTIAHPFMWHWVDIKTLTMEAQPGVRTMFRDSDKLVAVAGVPVSSYSEVFEVLVRVPPGTSFRITVRRGDTLLDGFTGTPGPWTISKAPK